MNSKIIFGLVGSFIAGACAGIAGTFVYMKKSYCDAKIDEGIQDYILHRYDKENEEVSEGEGDSDNGNDGETKEEPHISATTVPKYVSPDNERVRYNEFYDKKSPQDILAEREHPVDSDEDSDDNDNLEGMNEEETENYLEGLSASEEHAAYVRGELDPIEIIPESEWDTNPEYTPITLFYWLGDDILADEQDEVVFDILKESLSDLFTDEVIAKAQADPENFKIFVRNHEFAADYMILFVTKAYWENH